MSILISFSFCLNFFNIVRNPIVYKFEYCLFFLF